MLNNNKLYNFNFLMKIIFLTIILNLFFVNMSFANDCLMDKEWYKTAKTQSCIGGLKTEANKYIILHHTKNRELEKIKTIYEKYNVSTHYFITLDGEIIYLINNDCMAYHAGVSSWKEDTFLNKNSIGIEILLTDPLKDKPNKKQYKALINLLKELKVKYNIDNRHILSHSDIAYFDEKKSIENEMPDLANLKNRKQDVSENFDWKILAQNNVGVWYDDSFLITELKKPTDILFYFGDKKEELIETKQKLKNIGYNLEINDEFNIEFYMISIIFHRHFFKEHFIFATQGYWTDLASKVLALVENEYKFE